MAITPEQRKAKVQSRIKARMVKKGRDVEDPSVKARLAQKLAGYDALVKRLNAH